MQYTIQTEKTWCGCQSGNEDARVGRADLDFNWSAGRKKTARALDDPAPMAARTFVNDPSKHEGLQHRAKRIAFQAERVVQRARLLGWLGLLSALWLWLLIFVILGSIPNFLLAAPAALIGLVLALPGAVMLLTTLGLKSLTRLPQRLGGQFSPPTDDWASRRRSPLLLLRQLWALQREMLGYKLTLVRYAGAVRLFTLPALLLICLAVLACLFQLLLALFSMLLVLVSVAL